jgi:hypothetical protein
MRLAVLIAPGAVAPLLTPMLAQEMIFATVPLGAAPSDFEAMQTDPGEPGPWKVVQDSEAFGGKAVQPRSP